MNISLWYLDSQVRFPFCGNEARVLKWTCHGLLQLYLAHPIHLDHFRVSIAPIDSRIQFYWLMYYLTNNTKFPLLGIKIRKAWNLYNIKIYEKATISKLLAIGKVLKPLCFLLWYSWIDAVSDPTIFLQIFLWLKFLVVCSLNFFSLWSHFVLPSVRNKVWKAYHTELYMFLRL